VPMNDAASTGMRRLPIMYAPPIPVTVRRIFHTVRRGETLTSIANKYRVSVEDLKRWNGVTQAVAGRTLMLEVRAASKGKPRPKAKSRIYKKANR
jgi:spore germination protein YaaH